MKTEFNLSEKKHELSTIDKLTLGIPVENNEHIYYKEEDVKEFIRLLKEELVIKLDLKTIYPKDYKIVMDMINKLAGENGNLSIG
jgi:RNase H-fold protein (predicted Holliday junction resolvase)